MNKFIRTAIMILTFLALVFGTIDIIKENNKIIETSVRLIILNDNAQYYNEQPIKTNEMTQKYRENDKLRQEIYNSEDSLIRFFSNQIAPVKIAILILAILIYPLIVLLWLRQIFLLLNNVCKLIKVKNTKIKKK